MAELVSKTTYKVQVHGVVIIEVDNETDAKSQALSYFSEEPQQYLSILEVSTILVEGVPE